MSRLTGYFTLVLLLFLFLQMASAFPLEGDEDTGGEVQPGPDYI